MSEEPRDREGMSVIVRTVARWLRGPILLYGIYLIVFGHLTPGGGFSGGVVAAAAFILVLLAEGRAAGLRLFPAGTAARLDSAGALGFLGIALAGMVLGSGFFCNDLRTAEEAWFTLGSGGAIPFSNLAVGLKVGSSLFLVFAALALWHAAPGTKPAEPPAEEEAK
jgi:multicomponent Na+:H+ antiporter subunit B